MRAVRWRRSLAPARRSPTRRPRRPPVRRSRSGAATPPPRRSSPSTCPRPAVNRDVVVVREGPLPAALFLWLRGGVAHVKGLRRDLAQRVVDDRLGLRQHEAQVVGTPEAFGVDLVDVLGARGT